MCGIIGVIHKNQNTSSRLNSEILAQLAHRGPDDCGIYRDDYSELGHTRLSILDLSDAGHQPMLSKDGRYVLTYNGEIYNFIELRQELLSLGCQFKSYSDTEVLLAAYQVWGEKCVLRFRGMFAFVIWDSQYKTVFMARDRTGEKPLFYFQDPEKLLFSSELKGLLPLLDSRPKLNVSAIDLYFHYQYVPEPLTPLEGVLKLPAGHTLFITQENWDARPIHYWKVSEQFSGKKNNPEHADQLILSVLDDSVKLSLRSDVPVGIALSGGIDSSAIAVLASKHYEGQMQAFCVGYPNRPAYDERDNAKDLAKTLGMKIHEVELPISSFVDFFPQLVRLMDEPIADRAAFAHFSIPQAAASEGIKVMLSGIGGDELFWGYPWVARAAYLNQELLHNPFEKFIGSFFQSDIAQSTLAKIFGKQAVPLQIRQWANRMQEIGSLLNSKQQLLLYMAEPEFRNAFALKRKLYGASMVGLDSLNPFNPTAMDEKSAKEIPAAIIQMLFDTWLVSNCLGLSDRTSMSVGVETRLPFLDVKLIELVMHLRLDTPDHRAGHKALLRQALRSVLPDQVLNRPKSGFQPPVHEWLSAVVNKYGAMLEGGELINAGIIDKAKCKQIMDKFANGNIQELFFIYKVVLLEMWYQTVVAPVRYVH